MATIKRGTLTPAPERWRHLKMLKRVFWKAVRRAGKADAAKRKLEARD